jgi:hypothetical protein
MYLPAISIGYFVPTDNFDASVHSVFQAALNLRLNGENNLLTLMASGDGDLPQGIRLDTPNGFSFERFQVGEPAICRDGILHFEKNSLTVQLYEVRRWKCDLPALRFDAGNPAMSAAWTDVWDALNRRQRRSKSEIVAEELFRSNKSPRGHVLRKAGEVMRGLLESTQRYELTNAVAIRALVGLGSGLTPSGDDLLVGYLAGLWSTVQEQNERLQFISTLGQMILPLLSQTNDISRTYLSHATQGQVSSRLVDLIEAICRGKNSERLSDLAEVAMNVGHTSGMDAVTGMLIGLTAWEDNQLFSR